MDQPAAAQQSFHQLFLDGSLRSPILIGGTAFVLFFVVFLGMASFFPLASGASAPGIVSPEGSRKTIQHLEGGIIAQLLVKDGDEVDIGDPLLILASARAQARFSVDLERRRTLSATIARLQAEQQSLEDVVFPSWLQDQMDAAGVTDIMTSQTVLFQTRRDTKEGQKAILQTKVLQLKQEITGVEAQITSSEKQISLISEEIKDVEELISKGLGRKPRLLALQRTKAQLQGEMGENVAAVARQNQVIAETELKILNLEAEWQANVADDLNNARFSLASIEKEIAASEDVLARTTIIAPTSGTIVNRRFATVGGVIAPGAPILDIVPSEAALIIEARINPMDVDVVHAGLEAKVYLSAFSHRRLRQISGTVKSISADAFLDEASGRRYFRAEVEVDRAELDKAAVASGLNLELTPGMPAEVLIITGSRTLMSYLMDPLRSSLRQSFVEG